MKVFSDKLLQWHSRVL